jgi:hypothetical protein
MSLAEPERVKSPGDGARAVTETALRVDLETVLAANDDEEEAYQHAAGTSR